MRKLKPLSAAHVFGHLRSSRTLKFGDGIERHINVRALVWKAFDFLKSDPHFEATEMLNDIILLWGEEDIDMAFENCVIMSYLAYVQVRDNVANTNFPSAIKNGSLTYYPLTHQIWHSLAAIDLSSPASMV